MLRYIDHTRMGRAQHGWLDSHFHFSFAEYYNPANMHFGVLRVLNDDLVKVGTGFDTHPHENMEIISYVVDGELTHKDSMGNESTLTRGQVQYMSAGTGVLHSEYNNGDKLLRFLQIWILPDGKGYKPNYGDYRFKLEDRHEKWLPIATSYNNAESAAPIKIHNDINMYASILPAGKSIDFQVAKGRQAYLMLIEGGIVAHRDERCGVTNAEGRSPDERRSIANQQHEGFSLSAGEVTVKDITLKTRDALEITGEDVHITADEESHFIVIEMEKWEDEER